MTLDMKRPPVLGSQDNSRDGSLAIETNGLSKSFEEVTNLRPSYSTSPRPTWIPWGAGIAEHHGGVPPFDKISCQET